MPLDTFITGMGGYEIKSSIWVFKPTTLTISGGLMRNSTTLVRRIGILVGVPLFFISAAGTAYAEECNESANGGRITGTFSAANGYVTWDLKIEDIAADGHCVYIEVQPDIAYHTDPEMHSSQACPKGEVKSFSGREHYINLRGVRIKICSTNGVPDTCVQVDYNANN